jgi:peptidoglycan-N-acetylglucosamine deacetylase
MFYFVKTPWWLRKMYDSYTWRVNRKGEEGKTLYLTFDDGPHPVATPFVLQQLKKYNAIGTFFCIGKNVVAHPEIYRQIISEGHAIGNHTYNHLNGWKTNDEMYMKDVSAAAQHIDSHLFRPPYGRITSFQAKNLKAAMKGKTPKVIMWDVLSADFDVDVTPRESAANVLLNARSGSIVVFHDSEKAFPRLEYALPRVLEHFSRDGYRFSDLE